MISLIYNIIIYPIELLVEFIFVFFMESFGNVGIAIAGISIVVSLLALPLYNIADSLQRKERDERIRLKPGVDRIKAVFKGDEQYMILSTYYRQNHYHPAYALRSSISLMIQVPFFIAAYHFLSNLEQLQGTGLFFITDLGKPDKLLSLDGIGINVLPILMTMINLIAGVIYTKGFPFRDKAQLYTMAVLFLVLLYNSPSGLVLYWTLNNIFSLLKNCFYKLKKPLRILYFCAIALSISLTIAIIVTHPWAPPIKLAMVIAICGFICFLPLVILLIHKLYMRFLAMFADQDKQRNYLFVVSCLLLWLLCGLVVPTNLISSSTIEFSFTGIVDNPLSYVVGSLSMFFGIWCFWPFVIYLLSPKKMKAFLSFFFCVLSLSAILNLFVFSGDYGTISYVLLFENPSLLKTSRFFSIVSLFSSFSIVLCSLLMIHKTKANVLTALITIIFTASLVTGVYSCRTINREFLEHKENMLALQENGVLQDELKPVFHLSRHGKNVVILFLDRAINSFFPLAVDQFPELKEQFRGFVYYPNTVSFGLNTATGAPAMLGGYEYTPEQMNLRDSEKMVDKHNEALLVLPRIFNDSGYAVTVSDPPYSNYKLTADYTPYEPYLNIQVKNLLGKYSVRYKQDHSDVLDWDESRISSIIKTRLTVFSLLKTTLPLLRETLYDSGKYLLVDENPQNSNKFVDSYSLLYYLNDLTDYEATTNTYTFIANEAPHEPVLLQGPEYEPRKNVTSSKTELSGVPNVSDFDIATYQVNAATLKRIGLWLEKLQSDGMYDNTRIIIVSDHGYSVSNPRFSDFEKNKRWYAMYNPLLLVKDFGSENELSIDKSFMTNADAPLFALEKLDVSTINPFTGQNMYLNVDKSVVDTYDGGGANLKGNTYTFDFSKSYSVHDDISVESNWSPIKAK